jgi:DNA-binding transcriptional ArsR family regulator
MADNSPGTTGPTPEAGRATPDYELDDTIELRRPDQLKAIGDPLRFTILGLLSERAATTSQLAEALGRPRGTIGHHLKVLEAAGLIRVVRTRSVRALTEKYYGRVARLSLLNEAIDDDRDGRAATGLALRQALSELSEAPMDPAPIIDIRHARLTPETAARFAARVEELAAEFDEQVDPTAPVYGFAAAVYQTSWPTLPEDQTDTATEPTSGLS